MKKRKPIYIIYYYVLNKDNTYTEHKKKFKSKHSAWAFCDRLSINPMVMSIDVEEVK
jgi:hypothetical protein